jgi:hypothetical protein
VSKAPPERLEALHGALVDALLARVKSGEATAADLAVARQLLKDNGIDAIPTEASPLARLRDSLPFPDPEALAREQEVFN